VFIQPYAENEIYTDETKPSKRSAQEVALANRKDRRQMPLRKCVRERLMPETKKRPADEGKLDTAFTEARRPTVHGVKQRPVLQPSNNLSEEHVHSSGLAGGFGFICSRRAGVTRDVDPRP